MIQIIDAHIHPDERGWGKSSPGEMVDACLEPMDRNGVWCSGLLGRVHCGQSADEVRTGNDAMRAMVAHCPERFYGLCFVNPALSKDEVAGELDRCLALPEFVAIKLELDVNCLDRRMEVVAEKALEFNVPILHHSWYVNLWNYPTPEKQKDRSEPWEIAEWARRHPELRILMAHMEGCGERGIQDIADVPNVWIDTSGSQPFAGTLEYALRLLGASRIVFGSDLFGRSLEPQLARIFDCTMSAEDREKILWRNAAQLFGLPEPEPLEIGTGRKPQP